MKKQPTNGSRLDETTALLQQAMATLLQNQATFLTARASTDVQLQQALATKLQNQVLFEARWDQRDQRIERRFEQIEQRLDKIEALLAKMFAEMPERIFGFAQAAAKKQSE